MRADSAHMYPAVLSRSFLTNLRPTNFFLPDARVMGAEPAYAFRARASVKRCLSSPISARIRAPSCVPIPGKLSMICASGCVRNASSTAVLS
ncbi:hypothetical protein D9M72_606020 [compost metagenome]